MGLPERSTLYPRVGGGGGKGEGEGGGEGGEGKGEGGGGGGGGGIGMVGTRSLIGVSKRYANALMHFYENIMSEYCDRRVLPFAKVGDGGGGVFA